MNGGEGCILVTPNNDVTSGNKILVDAGTLSIHKVPAHKVKADLGRKTKVPITALPQVITDRLRLAMLINYLTITENLFSNLLDLKLSKPTDLPKVL